MLLTVLFFGCFGGVVLAGGSSGADTVVDTSDYGSPVDGVPMDGGLYVLDLANDPDPPVTGKTILHLRVGGGEDQAPVSGAAIGVVPFMPEMGHGISGEPDISEVGDGYYDAEWSYPMAGEWEVEVSILGGDLGQDTYTAIFEVG